MSGLRLFVIGRSGQVASALQAAATQESSMEVAFAGRPEIDMTVPETLIPALDAFEPDVVLNAAAHTAVDKAEDEPDLADAINHLGPKRLAVWSGETGVPFIHMSTDCVFDGTKPTAYVETDPVSPINVYGRSKADGEAAVANGTPRHLVVRVCWVHSAFGKSFPRTMLDLAETRDEVSVVEDQIGRPTHASDLSAGLLTMAKRSTETGFNDWGIYHLAGHGETDRASMARAVFEDSARYGGPTARVKGVSTEAFGARAPRPLNARIDSERAETVFGLRLPDWRARLTDCVRAIVMEDSRS